MARFRGLGLGLAIVAALVLGAGAGLFVAGAPPFSRDPAPAADLLAPGADRAQAAARPDLPAGPAGESEIAGGIERARAVLAEIQRRDGEPPPGYVGGRRFENRERRLPRGTYREYDVHPRVRGRDRGAERIVLEQRTGRAYYTPDHYRTFVRLN